MVVNLKKILLTVAGIYVAGYGLQMLKKIPVVKVVADEITKGYGNGF